MEFFLPFIVAFASAALLTPLTFPLARRFGAISHVNHRSSHTIPTPRLGGVALGLGFVIASGICFWSIVILAHKYHHDAPTTAYVYRLGFGDLPVGITLGWLSMFCLGLADDCLTLSAKPKLLWMVGTAALAIWLTPAALWVGPWSNPLYDLGGAFIGFAWLLYFTNAFNFMDGMDGFAASFAGFASLFLLACLRTKSAYINELFLIPLSALSGACWGFFLWNRPPARTFMGDAGSLGTGFALAACLLWLSIRPISMEKSGPLPSITSLTILMPFIFDSALTLIRRALRGENVLRAHREHLYQRLMQTGWSHARVLYLNWINFIACGVAAYIGFGAFERSGAAFHLRDAFVIALCIQCLYWVLIVSRETRHRRIGSQPAQ